MLRDFNSSSICMTDFHLSKKFYFIYFKTYIRPYCPARGGALPSEWAVVQRGELGLQRCSDWWFIASGIQMNARPKVSQQRIAL